MKTADIIRDVALLLGADPAAQGCDTPFPTLAERAEGEIEECAAEAILSMPRVRLTGWRLLPGDRLAVGSDGTAVLPLPDDFLLLFCVRLSGWEREVTEALPADHWLAKLQATRWHGLRGTPSRPVAVEGRGAGGERTLRLYSASPGAAVEEGWYLPAPRIDRRGEIDIPPCAYRETLRLMAARLRG